MRERLRIDLSEEEYHALTAVERELLERLAVKNPGFVPRETKPIRFREDVTPESMAEKMADKVDDLGAMDVTEFFNVVKPRSHR